MRPARVVVGALATLLVAGALLLSALREVDTAAQLPAMLTAFASFAVVGFGVGLLLLLALLRRSRRRRWVAGGIVVALLGLALQAVWQGPLFVGGTDRRADLTVMTGNLQFGTADPAAVVAVARRSGAQVVVLEEVTFGELPRLQAAGMQRRYPYSAGLPDYSAAGTVVFSRFPLTDVQPLPVSNGALQVRVGAPRPFTLVGVHPGQPLRDPLVWHADLGFVRAAAVAAAAAGPTVVAGDFNATRDHPAFRAILRDAGLRDAAEAAGSGWQPTWPDSLPKRGPGDATRDTWLHPLITIDHVLVSRQFAVVSTRTAAMPGSDHRALIARLSTAGLPG